MVSGKVIFGNIIIIGLLFGKELMVNPKYFQNKRKVEKRVHAKVFDRHPCGGQVFESPPLVAIRNVGFFPFSTQIWKARFSTINTRLGSTI